MSMLKTSIVPLAISLVFCGDIKAQASLQNAPERSSFGAELLYSKFGDGSDFEDISTITGVLAFNTRVAPKVTFFVEVPYTRSSWEFENYNGDMETHTGDAIGNILVGIEATGENKNLFFRGGLRLPTSPTDDWARIPGAMSNFSRSFQAFTPKQFIVDVAGGYRYLAPSGLCAEFKAGPALWMSTDEEWRLYDEDQSTEIFLNYKGYLGYDAPKILAGGGIMGMNVMTDEEITDGDRSIFEGYMIAAYKFARVQPGIKFILPLTDELREEVDFTAGITFNVLIG